MEMFGQTITASYQNEAFGIWGHFNTTSGDVSFLETKARLGLTGTDAESRLTRYLKPVREVLNTRSMDFNQLLQRDLDDHRVALELVPYLMCGRTTGPAFFPPVVAALLPFNGVEPLEHFPQRSDIEKHQDPVWGHCKGYAHGEAFQFEQLVAADGSSHHLKLGRLKWNEERTQLVVLDGQHRAMALLAIFRTMNNLWDGQGEKYKHFYEGRVQDELRGMSVVERVALANIELPVTLLWFPQTPGKEPIDHQLAARKLFVDVNKNARTPSPARLLLLDDTHLTAIFTRCVLNEFRNRDTQTLPVAAIEYDHPERDQTSAAKWSAVTTVSIIESCIQRAVFGPAQYISDASSTKSPGRENVAAGGRFMRDTLDVSREIPATVEDHGEAIERDHITDEKFPRMHLPFLQRTLIDTWGGFIVRMLSDVLPFREHGEALKELGQLWSPSDVGRLAKDAIFEGVGMYWTLKDSHEHWQEVNRLRTQTDQPKLPKSDVVRAWEETELRRGEFEAIRAHHYLGSRSDEKIEQSRACYEIFATYACQVGLALAARTLAYRANTPVENVAKFTDDFVSAVNAGLAGGSMSLGRRRFLARDASKPLNLLAKLDTPIAFYFRYLWLELIGSPEARPFLTSHIASSEIDHLIEVGRYTYLVRITDELRRNLKRTNPEWKADKLDKEASKGANTRLRSALKYWFDLPDEQYDSWLNTRISTNPSSEDIDADAERVDSVEADLEDEGAGLDSLSISELLDRDEG